LASASYDDTIKLYHHDSDNGDWSTIATLTGHQSTVWGIDFDSTGNRISSCSDDKTVKIWQKGIKEWSCVCTLAGYHKRAIYDISWNKLNGLIATAAGDNHIRIFQELSATNELEKNRFQQLFALKVSQADVNCVKWNPSKKNILASVSDDGNLRVWEWKKEI
jgi:WD40 repeat protein